MIIELFGPPTAGKTTFARNLATRLRATGQPVELILSLRPAETIEPAGDARSAPPPWPAMRRLARPAIEFLACMGQIIAGSGKTGIASELIDILPPASSVWSVRLHQYITRLDSSWRLAKQSDATVIIDQGFVQAVCSLALLVRTPPTANALEKALTLVPKADAWIRIDAPWQLLRARLEARRSAQSWIERRLELDTETSLRSLDVLNMLDPILRLHAPRIAHIGQGQSWPPQDLPDIAEFCNAMTQADAIGMHAR